MSKLFGWFKKLMFWKHGVTKEIAATPTEEATWDEMMSSVKVRIEKKNQSQTPPRVWKYFFGLKDYKNITMNLWAFLIDKNNPLNTDNFFLYCCTIILGGLGGIGALVTSITSFWIPGCIWYSFGWLSLHLVGTIVRWNHDLREFNRAQPNPNSITQNEMKKELIAMERERIAQGRINAIGTKSPLNKMITMNQQELTEQQSNLEWFRYNLPEFDPRKEVVLIAINVAITRLKEQSATLTRYREAVSGFFAQCEAKLPSLELKIETKMRLEAVIASRDRIDALDVDIAHILAHTITDVERNFGTFNDAIMLAEARATALPTPAILSGDAIKLIMLRVVADEQSFVDAYSELQNVLLPAPPKELTA